jgi:hypothetical protein
MIVHIDPVTLEWVFPDGRRIPVIAGGSVMSSDDTSSSMEMDLDEPDDSTSRGAGDDDDDDDDSAQSRDDDWTPPDRAEWERIKAALKGERRDRKKDKREFEEKVKNLTTSGTAAAIVEIEQARIDEREKVEKKWTRRAVRAEAAAMFASQGASATNAERLARMVDIDKINYDERDEEFDGLEEEVEDIIAENPEFFRKPKNEDAADDSGSTRTPRTARPRVEAATRGARGGGAQRKQSSAERLAARALGRQPRRQ